MADTLLALVRGKAEEWRGDAVKRRRPGVTDPVADTLEACAAELEAVVGGDAVYIDVDGYARIHPSRPHPQTVRRWCRLGWLPATLTKKGYLIHRDATVRPVKPEHRRAG